MFCFLGVTGMAYDDARWRRLRLVILRRDGYLCRNCRRYGRSRAATIVHHVWPVEDWPEYRWARWNLLSLCAECHAAMHDRQTRRLTDSGERWRRKTAPPPSAAETSGGLQLAGGCCAHAAEKSAAKNPAAGEAPTAPVHEPGTRTETRTGIADNSAEVGEP